MLVGVSMLLATVDVGASGVFVEGSGSSQARENARNRTANVAARTPVVGIWSALVRSTSKFVTGNWWSNTRLELRQYIDLPIAVSYDDCDWNDCFSK